MKDKQFQSAGPAPGLPIISPLLHVISMTGLVFLRTSFGYAFLSPKSIFLACAWAHGLFCFYAWHEPGVWPRWKAVALYGIAAAGLYLIHLFKALAREIARKGKHDYHAGTSHFMRLAWLFQPGIRDRLAAFVHLWLEPGFVLIVAAFFAVAGISKLPAWLTLLAFSMWGKEAINYWYRLRHHKKQSDVFSDAEEGMDHYPGTPAENNANAGTGRKPKKKRARVLTDVESKPGEEADRYAEVLRMLPPYSLEQAETNYRALMKLCHPDSGAARETADVSKRAADLKEALRFFREQEEGA